MERIQQLLGSKASVTATTKDTFLKVNLEASQVLLPHDDINEIINVGEQFNTERQSSTYYRLIGTIRTLMSNSLFNLSGNNSWYNFNNNEFRDRSYPKNVLLSDPEDLSYGDSIKEHLKEKDGWFGYYNPDITQASLCTYNDMEPKRERFYLTPYNDIKNWDFTITYPFSSDTAHFLVNNGLFICDKINVSVGNRPMIALGLPVKHNLTAGETVRISGTSFDGDYSVVKLGLDDGSLPEYYFVIDKTGILNIGSNSRFKKVLNGEESSYYFRLFKKIKTRNQDILDSNDYSIYNLGFSQNVFNDPVNQIIFNEDLDVSNLRDNLNRPLSELYLSIFKTNSNDGTFSFNDISSGIEVPFISELNNSNQPSKGYLLSIPVINKIHNGVLNPFPSHTPIETSLTIDDDYYYGDIVEYNRLQLRETIISEVNHRFNTANRETNPIVDTTSLGPRQEGYYYKAHHQIIIREFSNYIEQGDKSTEGIPDYAVNLGDGRYLWRDLMDIGINNGSEITINYPFLNGAHYLHQNYCFTLKRQDAFAKWGLYYNQFPADPIGDVINDKFSINSNQTNDC